MYPHNYNLPQIILGKRYGIDKYILGVTNSVMISYVIKCFNVIFNSFSYYYEWHVQYIMQYVTSNFSMVLNGTNFYTMVVMV